MTFSKSELSQIRNQIRALLFQDELQRLRGRLGFVTSFPFLQPENTTFVAGPRRARVSQKKGCQQAPACWFPCESSIANYRIYSLSFG